MIESSVLDELATRYHTTRQNVAREYCQHLFLANLYKLGNLKAERLLFKGGTALRIIHQSPRFSEDLDFSSFGLAKKDIEDIFISGLDEIEKSGIATNLTEAKETSGGYLGKAYFKLFDFRVEIMIQVQAKQEKRAKGEVRLVSSDFIPAYNLLVLPEEILVGEKMIAAVTRAKPRDFYDVYFILRKNLLAAGNKKILPDVLEKT